MKWQKLITRHAKAKRWTTDSRTLFDVATCLRLVKTFDPQRFPVIPKGALEVHDGQLLKMYCESVGLSEKRRVYAAPVSSQHYVATDAFLESYEWRRVRMVVLKRDGAICACCGATRADGVVMNVDHIKPRRLFPSLALDPNNLQVLCGPCNHGKGNWDMTDWRDKHSDDDPAVEFARLVRSF